MCVCVLQWVQFLCSGRVPSLLREVSTGPGGNCWDVTFVSAKPRPKNRHTQPYACWRMLPAAINSSGRGPVLEDSQGVLTQHCSSSFCVSIWKLSPWRHLLSAMNLVFNLLQWWNSTSLVELRTLKKDSDLFQHVDRITVQHATALLFLSSASFDALAHGCLGPRTFATFITWGLRTRLWLTTAVSSLEFGQSPLGGIRIPRISNQWLIIWFHGWQTLTNLCMKHVSLSRIQAWGMMLGVARHLSKPIQPLLH